MLLRARIVGIVVLLAACGQPEEPEPARALPAGLLIEGDVEPTRAFVDQLASLSGTPLGTYAAEARDALAGCETGFSVEADSIEAGRAVTPRCSGMPGPLRPVLGPAPLAFAVPLDEHARLIGSAHFADGGVQATGWLEIVGDVGGLAVALPDGDAGPAWLDGETSVVHARGRSQELLDPEALAGSDAADVLQLRGGVLADALLDRRWELAVYPPSAAGGSPPLVFALGHRSTAAARAALQGMTTGLQQRWALPMETIQLGDARGWCVADLHLLPELLPCGVVTDQAIVLGWHRAALEGALGGTPPTGSGDAWLHADLERMEAADSLIAPDREPTTWPWSTLTLTAEDRDGTTHLGLDLSPRAVTP